MVSSKITSHNSMNVTGYIYCASGFYYYSEWSLIDTSPRVCTLSGGFALPRFVYLDILIVFFRTIYLRKMKIGMVKILTGIGIFGNFFYSGRV